MPLHPNLRLITEKTHDVLLDIAYAREDNVAKYALYAAPVCYLHKEAEACLQKAIFLAKEQGCRLKIFDGFRPIEAQRMLYDRCPESEFVSNPHTGAVPHCRGVAVDLTLIDSVTHQELPMGTEFDHFGPTAFHGAEDVSAIEKANRYLLLGIMTTAGWDFFRNEWWHYQLFLPRNFDILTDAEAGTQMIVA